MWIGVLFFLAPKIASEKVHVCSGNWFYRVYICTQIRVSSNSALSRVVLPKRNWNQQLLYYVTIAK